MPPQPQPARRGHQGGGVKTGQHRAQATRAASRSRSASQDTNRRYGSRRGQALSAVAGEQLPHQDRQRPAIHHDVVIGQHKPVSRPQPAGSAPPETPADRPDRTPRHARQHTPARAAHRHRHRRIVDVDIAPRHPGISRNDLHRLIELPRKPRHQMRMPVHHRIQRIPQPVLIKPDHSTRYRAAPHTDHHRCPAQHGHETTNPAATGSAAKHQRSAYNRSSSSICC